MRARDHHRLAQAGFLLTETLATFALSAVVLVGLMSIAPYFVRSLDLSVDRMQNTEDLGRTFGALVRDVASLMRARWNGFEPQSYVFRGGPNSLFYARHERGVDGTPEIHVIALREIVVRGGTRLVRSEAKLPVTATSFDDLHFGPQRALPTGGARLRFWYVPPRKSGDAATTPSREATWDSGPELPEAVVVEAVDASTKRLLVSTRIPIRTNADIGCLPSSTSNGANPTAPGTGQMPDPNAQAALAQPDMTGMSPQPDPTAGAQAANGQGTNPQGVNAQGTNALGTNPQGVNPTGAIPQPGVDPQAPGGSNQSQAFCSRSGGAQAKADTLQTAPGAPGVPNPGMR